MATMSARYTVIDGEVIAQERGGVRHQLVPDPLGSTIALYDNLGTKTDTFSYWPYAESSGRTGTTNVKFQYLGSYGYCQDSEIRKYVRARYLSANQGRWISQDLTLLHKKNAYCYVIQNPISLIDFTGKYPQETGKPIGLPKVLIDNCLSKSAQNSLNEILKNEICASEIAKSCEMSALEALNENIIAPLWEFPQICNPKYGKKPGGQCRTFLPTPNPRPEPGQLCVVKSICITQSACKLGNGEATACMVLFELGNACQCASKGFQPAEDTAIRIRNACGCKNYVDPGGVNIIK